MNSSSILKGISLNSSHNAVKSINPDISIKLGFISIQVTAYLVTAILILAKTEGLAQQQSLT